MRVSTILAILFFGTSWGQNLVPNPSFEILTQCPDDAGQLNFANGWINPTTIGTPDLFNDCSFVLDIPSYCSCDYAYQFPSEGLGYIGLWFFQRDFPNAREYAETPLIAPMISGNCYLISLKINLLNGSAYATNNVGFYFSQSLISSSSNLFNYNAQIFNNNVISDTSSWVDFKGIYLSTGNEAFMTIGNFFNDINTDTLRVNNNTFSSGSYYLFDDVSVISISDLPNSMPAYAGADTSILVGDSIFIGQEISNLNCTWSVLGGSQIADSISGIWVSPTATTSYVVEQNLCGSVTYDTVTVFVHGVGVSSLEGEKSWVTIAPNPNNSIFEIDLSKFNTTIIELMILDASGRIVFKKDNVTESKLQLETNLNKGVYFLKLRTDKGVFEEKIVIQ